MKKRLLSILLTVCLILSLIPMTVFADTAENPGSVQEELLQEEESQELEELSEEKEETNEEESGKEAGEEETETGSGSSVEEVIEAGSESSAEEEEESLIELEPLMAAETLQTGTKPVCTQVTVTSVASEEDDFCTLLNISLPASYANGEEEFLIVDAGNLFQYGVDLSYYDEEYEQYGFYYGSYAGLVADYSKVLLSDEYVGDVEWEENEADDGYHLSEAFVYQPVEESTLYLLPGDAESSDDFVFLCKNLKVTKYGVFPKLEAALYEGDSLEEKRSISDKYGKYTLTFLDESGEPASGLAKAKEYYNYSVTVDEFDSKYGICKLCCNNSEMEYDEESSCYYPGDPMMAYETGASLVNMLLSDKNTKVSNIKVQGTAESFTQETLGIEKGLLLDTSGKVPQQWKDTDLEKLLDYPYGGHTASLEFDLVANGNLLLFDYVFASKEFNCGAVYNDMFALFVSTSKDGVNWSEPENIARFKDSEGVENAVSLNSLRGAFGKLVPGMEDPGMYKSYSVNDPEVNPYFSCSGTYGWTYVMTARKEIEIGSHVRLKFVICDVSDTSVDSYVAIKADSISFINAKSDYLEKKIYDLEPGEVYTVRKGDTVYTVTADEDGIIPFEGKDDNNLDYNFRGGKSLITRVSTGEEGYLEVAAPQEAKVITRTVTSNSVSVPVAGAANYAIVPAGSGLSAEELQEEYENFMAGNATSLTWVEAEEEQEEITFPGLEAGTEYIIYSIIPATKDAPESNGIGARTVKTMLAPVAASVQDVTAPENNFGGAEWGLEEEELEEVFSIEESEKDEGVNIWIEVSDSSDTVSVISRDKIETAAGNISSDAEVLQYLDINVFKQVGTNPAEKVQPGRKITITLTVPGELRREDGRYCVLYLHNGKTNKITPDSYDHATGRLTFSAEMFSDYALVHATERPAVPEEIVTTADSSDDDVTGGWILTSNGWIYTYSNGTDIRGKWAYLYNPYAKEGQEQYSWFHFAENGILDTGWFTDTDGQVYYLNPVSDNTLGMMFHGDAVIDGKTYHFNEPGEGTYGALAK